MTDWLAHPVVQGAFSGLLSAAVIDFLEFRKWQRWEDGIAYDWSLASFRWFKGVVVGAVSAFGMQVGLTMLA